MVFLEMRLDADFWHSMASNLEEGAVTDWKPIETAPKDHTEILVFEPGYGVLTAKQVGGSWYPSAQDQMAYDGSESLMSQVSPTHWMPLPAPPVGVD